jgi:para-aminobenzoate synthetase component 1
MNLQADIAIAKMNKLGGDGTPFLFVIDFEMDSPLVLKIGELDSFGIKFKIEEKNIPLFKKQIFFEKHPISFQIYSNAFNYVINQIGLGNSYLTNLTFPTEIKTNLTLDEIYTHSRARYKLLFENRLVVFSPECFVKIEDGIISSYPMKGTIDASIPSAEEIILNDEKEMAEHITIVDLIRNDLSIVARDVHVEKFRYVEKLETNSKSLLQVSSKIVGRLEQNYNKRIGDIIFSMLPAGSISGAPKKKTVEIIQQAEQIKRGYYTGVFGYFDGRNLDSAVMIRFIERPNNGLIYRSGGGITFMSDVNSEYQELIDKVYVPFN